MMPSAGPLSATHTDQYNGDIPESLARLLRRYLPSVQHNSFAAPTRCAAPPSAVSSASPPMATVASEAWSTFLTVRWAHQTSVPPPPPPLSPRPPLPPAPHEDGRSSPQRQTAAPDCQTPTSPSSPTRFCPSVSPMRSATGALPRSASLPDSCSTRNDGGDRLRHENEAQRQLQPLQLLQVHYPHDVSACIDLSTALCSSLEVMRAVAPPVLPGWVLEHIATTTSTDVAVFLQVCEEGRGCGTTAAVDGGACKGQRSSPSAGGPTCPCGCVVGGRLLDAALYRFHMFYHVHHLDPQREPAHIAYGASQADTKKVKEGAPREAERRAVTMAAARGGARAIYPEAPVASPRDPASPHAAHQSPPGRAEPLVPPCAPPMSLPGLMPLQKALQLTLLPLIAVQTLSSFVWASSAPLRSVMARQRRRRMRRLWREDQRARTSATHGATPQNRRVPATELPEIPGGPLDGYARFCDEAERLWVVLACILLAWKQLDQYVSMAVLVPRLEVLFAAGQPPVAHHRGTSAARRGSQGRSQLECLAESAGLSPSALSALLLRSTSAAASTSAVAPSTTSPAHISALARLRVRLLAAPTRTHRPSHHPAGAASHPLLVMERFLITRLQGRIARQPLWCAVAVELLQLYVEHRRCSRAMQARCAREAVRGTASTSATPSAMLPSGFRAAATARLSSPEDQRETSGEERGRCNCRGVDDDEEEGKAKRSWARAVAMQGEEEGGDVWERVACCGMQQLVSLASRLLLLPCVFTSATEARLDGEKKMAPQGADGSGTVQRGWRHSSSASSRGDAEEGFTVGEAWHASPWKKPRHEAEGKHDLAESPATAAAAAVAQLSVLMTSHPLFGVAVAVVGGGVPLSWAAACIAPRAMSLIPAEAAATTAAPLRVPSSRENTLAAVEAADKQAWRELHRVVRVVRRVLREVGGSLS